MNKLITLGEVMLRLSTPGNARFQQAGRFDATYGGGEANVALALAQWDVSAAHVTSFPENDLGRAACRQLAGYGVNTKHIHFGPGRMGIYFLETGSGPRASRIIYDRADSAFARAKPEVYDWEKIFDGAEWFHWTGITPAISATAAAACKEALEVARKMGITISADINYRRNLWQYGKKVTEVMPELIALCDVVVAGRNDADEILGIRPSGGKDEDHSVFQQMMLRFPNIKKVLCTRRTSISASHNRLSARLLNKSGFIETETFEIDPIIDRVGGGDAFIAGFIYGQMNNRSDAESLKFGVASSVIKHTVEGDACIAPLEEIEILAAGNTSGQLLR